MIGQNIHLQDKSNHTDFGNDRSKHCPVISRTSLYQQTGKILMIYYYPSSMYKGSTHILWLWDLYNTKDSTKVLHN